MKLRKAAARIWKHTGFSALAVFACVLGGAAFRGGIAPLGDWWDLIRIGIVFALVALLIRKGWDVGTALLLAALALGLLFRVSRRAVLDAMTLGLFAPGKGGLHQLALDAMLLTGIVFLINILGDLLAARDGLKRLIVALEGLVRDLRYVGAVIPAAIGLLPTPGGAMLTAPIVGEMGQHMRMDGETKTLCNYWFRHVWEYWWPLFPSFFFLGQNMAKFSARDYIVAAFPLSLVAIVAGWALIIRRIPRPERTTSSDAGAASQIATAVRVMWPVGAVLAAVMLAPKGMSASVCVAALLGVNVVLALMKRVPAEDVLQMVRRSCTLRFAVLIFAVYILQGMFKESGAADRLPDLFRAHSVPVPLVCFAVPWIVGLLAGYTLAGVSTTFPLLKSLLVTASGDVLLGRVMLFYTGSFLGVIMSPTHLCLVLSREYFGADLGKVYRRLTPLWLCSLAAVAGLWLLLRRG